MINAKAIDIAEKLNQAGVPPKFGPDASRLLIRVMRALSEGQPVTNSQAGNIVADIGMDEAEAEQFLRAVTERDAKDNIVGIVGLSLNQEWVHRFEVNSKSLRTWCAWDTLFIPLLLNQTAMVASDSPISRKTIEVKVSPHGIIKTEPNSAVVSVVVLDPDDGPVGSVEDAWAKFCHQVYFFASREEAEEWSKHKNEIEILTVEEAFELGRHAWASVLEYI